MQNYTNVKDDILTEDDIIRRNLKLKLQQQLVLTEVLDQHKKFVEYDYWDTDVFVSKLDEFKQKRNLDSFGENTYNAFLNLAKLKRSVEQNNNVAWIKKTSQAVRPDIFNASLSKVAIEMLEEKIKDLNSGDIVLSEFQYFNYSQHLDQLQTCKNDVLLVKNESIIQKKAKTNAMWQTASQQHVSIDQVESAVALKI